MKQYIAEYCEALIEDKLEALKKEKVMEVEIVDQPNGEKWFEDDHCICMDAKLKLSNGETIEAGFYWVGIETIADLIYASKGYKPALEEINKQFQSYLESAEGFC